MLMASQIPIAEVVRLLARLLIAGEIVGRRGGARGADGLAGATGRLGRCARPEFEHHVLVIRGDWPLGLHCCQSDRVALFV